MVDQSAVNFRASLDGLTLQAETLHFCKNWKLPIHTASIPKGLNFEYLMK
jgi:hypothetical protein